MSQEPLPSDLDLPKLRMIGRPPEQTWQWKFRDDQWRDMMQSITVDMQKDEVTRLPDWMGGHVIAGGPSPFQWRPTKIGRWFGLGEDYPKVVADFDVLSKRTSLLPDDFLEENSSAYILAIAELWREVTGYVPAKGNQQARYDNEHTYKADIDGETELVKIAGDLAEDMDWRGIAEARGYDIDWNDPDAVNDFLYESHDDFARNIKYDDADAVSSGTNVASNVVIEESAADTAAVAKTATGSGTDRKVVAELGTTSGHKLMADQLASNIPNAMSEKIDGQWVVTVPPGQGGFENIDAGDAFIRDSGLDPNQWEMAALGEGQLVIREKKPEVATEGHDTVAESRAALELTGADPNQYEFRAGTGGKIYPVYVGKPEDPLTYSTPGRWEEDPADPDNPIFIPGTPGDMFEPTITEDPTGRKIGLDAQGRLQDFGYGMAGDITQESLAGYQVPERSLDMIVAKAIEQGNWELARGVQAFKDRPTERELLDYAAQYAEAPADLAVLSAIARGEQMVQPAVPLPEGMGTGMGQATRIGPPGEVYTSAYKSFIDSMNQGYVPNEDQLRELFDPKNDPAYIATQDLANKYETEIGTLRDQIHEANKYASERIENNQTQTMNMMSGMFENTISSFRDLMKENTAMKDSEIERLLARDEERRLAAGRELDEKRKREEERRLEEERLRKLEQDGAQAVAGDGDGDVAARETEEFKNQQLGLNKMLADKASQEAFQEALTLESAAPLYGTTSKPYGTTVTEKASTPWVEPDLSKHQFSPAQTNMAGPWFEPDLKKHRPPNIAEFMAEGGIVQGPTMAMLGEEEPEFIVPFSKVDEFRRGHLPLGKPRQSQTGGTVANFTDSMPRFANGGLVTGPRFGGVTARGLEQYGDNGAYVTPETRADLELGAEGPYGANGIGRAPRIGSSDFESLLTQYATPESQRYLREGTTALGQTGVRDEATRFAQMGNIPEYELRQRLGASEFAGTNPAQHPIGIQQLMAGRPIGRPRSLMAAANMPTPSGQALRNMLPSEIEYYQKMGRMAGIPQAELEQEMRSVMPGGTRRTPLRMGARRVRQA